MADGSKETGDTMSLMLVDDNATFLRILQRFLEERGAGEISVIATAGGGTEALSKAPVVCPKIIVVDLAMPDMHGLEVIPRLRRILPDAGIIALTMLGGEGYRRAAIAAGADDFVTKGELEVELLPAIRRVGQVRGAAGGSSGHPAESPNAPDGDLERHRRMAETRIAGKYQRWTTCAG
jgi:DNA-binding NarL/FixJ family response regulator